MLLAWYRLLNMEYDKNSNNNNTLKHYLLYYNIIIINDLTIGHINIVIVNILKQDPNLECEMIQIHQLRTRK